jgi:hypothetical protein
MELHPTTDGTIWHQAEAALGRLLFWPPRTLEAAVRSEEGRAD